MHEYSKRIGEHIKSCYSDFNKMTREELDELKDWACVMKDLTESDINIRGIKAMDEAEQEEKMYGRMGYRGRAANGRFVHRPGRGRSAGYTPYLHMMEDGMDEYDMYDDIPYPMTGYRMGYTQNRRMSGNRQMRSNGMSGDNMSEGRSGYSIPMKNYSRYGESYDRYSDRRRHYHESGDADSKKKMEDSIGEVFDDMENVVQDVWKEMTPEQKQKYKARMTQLVQNMK